VLTRVVRSRFLRWVITHLHLKDGGRWYGHEVTLGMFALTGLTGWIPSLFFGHLLAAAVLPVAGAVCGLLLLLSRSL
jgi:hypothetical protein